MSKKVLITLIISVLSLVFLVFSGMNEIFGLLSNMLAVTGSFLGIWYLFSLLFKSLILDNKEKLYLVTGTFIALISFALGKFGSMLFFWLPGVIVGTFSLRIITSTLKRISSSITSPLQNKIKKTEEELKQPYPQRD